VPYVKVKVAIVWNLTVIKPKHLGELFVLLFLFSRNFKFQFQDLQDFLQAMSDRRTDRHSQLSFARAVKLIIHLTPHLTNW